MIIRLKKKNRFIKLPVSFRENHVSCPHHPPPKRPSVVRQGEQEQLSEEFHPKDADLNLHGHIKDPCSRYYLKIGANWAAQLVCDLGYHQENLLPSP